MKISIYFLLLIAASASSFYLTVYFIGGKGIKKFTPNIYFFNTSLLNESKRIINLENTFNTRDIGGFKTSSNKRVKTGMIYRSDNLDYLNEKDIEKLKDIGIKTVYDLREKKRINQYPDKLLESVNYINNPIPETQRSIVPTLLFNRKSLSNFFLQDNILLIEEQTHKLKEIFEYMSEEENLPLLIHCTNGKDRVGVIIAVIYYMLDVPRQDIIDDYMLSNVNHTKIYERFIESSNAQLLTRTGIPSEDLEILMGVESAWIIGVLNHIVARYGTIENYLLNKVQINKDTIVRLKEILLEEF